MGKQLRLPIGLFLILVTLTSGSAIMADEEALLVENLSFQADIYGDSGLETIEYLSDLSFQSFGGFGTNAHIYRANLVSGDQIAYAVSAGDPYAFSLQATLPDGESVFLGVTNVDYSAGDVTMPSPAELRFTWEIEQSGLHLNLHRRVTLLTSSQITSSSVISEVFSVENLGPAFTLDTFSEYLHLDDRARVDDYNCDGVSETLITTNDYSSHGYPVFAKHYKQIAGQYTDMFANGNYVTVNHNLDGTLSTAQERNVAIASYVTSTEKDPILAEQQMSSDIRTLMGVEQLPDRWYLRSYRTDDRGGIFVNGVMVVGSRYSLYPDSSLVNVCKYWTQGGDNYVSFASWDLGGCCSATWGFELRRNEKILWHNEGSAATGLGITYAKIVPVSTTGVVDSGYVQPSPDPPLDGDWKITVSADGGFAFVLVDDLPVAGSTNSAAQTVNIGSLLGQQDNHIHLNVWNDGTGSHEWAFVIRRDDTVVWTEKTVIPNGTRGRSHHLHLVIDDSGNIYPVLDLPADYPRRTTGSMTAFNSAFESHRITSVFDHNSPFCNDGNTTVLPYRGVPYPNPEGSCWGPGACSPILGCYDEHGAFDIDNCLANDGCLEAYAVYPAADGVIVTDETGWLNNSLGCGITMDHGNGWKTVYAHLEDPDEDGGTEEGDCEGVYADSGFVTRFDRIGKIGCSGSGCLGSHLHFVVKKDDRVVDPAGWDQDPEAVPDPWPTELTGDHSYPLWYSRDRGRLEVDPAEGGQLVSLGGLITVTVPVDFYNAPLTFALGSAPVGATGLQLQAAGVSFSISAVDGSGSFVHDLDANLFLQARFDPSRIPGIKLNTLSLYSWDESMVAWTSVPTGVDVEGAVATAEVNHLSIFALMGEPKDMIYLPLLLRY